MDFGKDGKTLSNQRGQCLPGPIPTRRGHRFSRFRRVLVHAGITVLLLLSYGVFSRHHFANSIRGYKGTACQALHDTYISRVEGTFLSVPSTESALNTSRYYATHPHLAGTDEDFRDAKDVLSFFQREFGIAPSSTEPIFDAGSPESRMSTLSTTSTLEHPFAWVDVYYPVMNTGNADGISLSILGANDNPIWTADLLEDGDPLDNTAAKYKYSIPPWHGLSAAGQAVGQLVYANYGTKDDYDKLVEAGVNLTSKIILARHGANYRGLKIQEAEKHGAAGVIMYNDPRDDGSVTIENGYLPYPAGPARNPTSIQRGSVVYLSTYPGDPTTPGYPAYHNATRLEAGNIPTIPSIPISWANAMALFEQEFGGIEEGRKLDGKLSTHLVKLTNDADTKVIPIWNTMAAIPGRIKDEVVILACHRDAWVMGGGDPVSGTVSLLEVVRGLGTLLQSGWKPLRTIIIASWDGEEYGLMGSTEFGEDFADWIQAHVVSYINVDIGTSGSQWKIYGSPSLAHLLKGSAQDVPHPTEANKTLWDALYDSGPYPGAQDVEFAEMWTQKNKVSLSKDETTANVLPLGSGSDYTVFLQRLGVASSDQGFAHTPMDAPHHYHSIYDSQMWQETYGDPGFHRHVAIAKNLGLMILRLAESIILPLNTTHYALELGSYVDIVEESASGLHTLPKLDKLRKAISKLQRSSLRLDAEKVAAEKVFFKALWKIPDTGPRPIDRVRNWIERCLWPLKESIPEFSFNSNALNVFSLLEEQEDLCESKHRNPLCDLIKAAIRVKNVNQKLRTFEQGFISEGGIKDREWYRHLGVAPGKYLGYGATTLPALSEAVLYERNVTLAEYEVTRLIDLIRKLAKDLKV